MLPKDAATLLKQGTVIPAHPLALKPTGHVDSKRQRALSRYYLAAGAGGLAVGVHTTQFAIRQHDGMLACVLELAADVVREQAQSSAVTRLMVAGICGQTSQAVTEARLARRHSYHLGLLSLTAYRNHSEDLILQHCQEVAREIPLFGFYLQPSVGGRILSFDFWRRFAEIPNLMAIKIAPFNRYQTLDVMRAVAESDRWDQITLYTGNDDAIVFDLLSQYEFQIGGSLRKLHFAGGLLGHWSCWTKCAVDLWQRCRQAATLAEQSNWRDLMVLAHQVTDMNAAIFDSANNFRGCIPGILTVLQQQGLLANTLCLDSAEKLSPGQANEIARVRSAYPHLIDDSFVADNLQQWLSD
ncbi:MAG: dihydrodipicolinate synthase family protein [Planctomycetales bacterium]|nr:dihydrodipicolinate synthase family protein [Planctomycetales bacterium]